MKSFQLVLPPQQGLAASEGMSGAPDVTLGASSRCMVETTAIQQDIEYI